MFGITSKELLSSDKLTAQGIRWAVDNLDYLNKPMVLLGTSTKVKKDSHIVSISPLHLRPADEVAIVTLCNAANSAGCKADCLANSGRLGMSDGVAAQYKRTILFLLRREWFEKQLLSEIDKAERKSKRTGIKKMFRLNATSDVDWTFIIEQRPDSTFYDYTKEIARIRRNKLPNYDLTYSASMFSKQSRNGFDKAVKRGHRIAIAVNTKDTKDDVLQTAVHFKGIMSFDKNDIRPYDPEVNGILVRKGSNKAERERENLKSNSFFVTLANLKEFNRIVGV
tara:strand:- start:187 stop:1029 length:843 start_codon:yes stop_codon:yes gene_type:complete